MFKNPTPNNHVTFQLVQERSKRRKMKLVDSLGYSYNIQSKRSYATYWQCMVYPRGNASRAMVIEWDRTKDYKKVVIYLELFMHPKACVIKFLACLAFPFLFTKLHVGNEENNLHPTNSPHCPAGQPRL